MAMRANQPFMLNAQSLWGKVGELLWQQLPPFAQNETYEMASYYAPYLYRGVKAKILPLLWEFQNPSMAPPRSVRECQLYGLSLATFEEFVFTEYLGTTFSMVKKVLPEKIPPSLPQKLERDERLLRKYNEPMDRWLNTRLRTYAGSLVDLHFGAYKRYHALSPSKQEILGERLEEAGEKAVVRCLYGITSSGKRLESFFPDFVQQFEGRMETVSSRFEFPDSPSLDGFVFFSFTFIELIAEFAVRMFEQLANPHSQLRERVEEDIRSSIHDNCRYLTEEMERYDLHYDSRRLNDYHLWIIQFDPLDALCFAIILEYKQKRHTQHRCSIKELAQRNGIDIQHIYNFSRRLKYHTRVDLLQSYQ